MQRIKPGQFISGSDDKNQNIRRRNLCRRKGKSKMNRTSAATRITDQELENLKVATIKRKIAVSELLRNCVYCFLDEPEKTLKFQKDILGAKAQGKCFK